MWPRSASQVEIYGHFSGRSKENGSIRIVEFQDSKSFGPSKLTFDFETQSLSRPPSFYYPLFGTVELSTQQFY